MRISYISGANFRVQLLDVEKDRVLKDQENLSLKAMLDQNKKKMRSIETKTVDDDSKICNLQRELEDYTSKYKAVKEKVNLLCFFRIAVGLRMPMVKV